MIAAHGPIVKFEGWNCRDWVMEIVGMMMERKWVQHDITDQATLVTRMKFASVATKEVYEQREIVPVVVPLV